MKTPLLPRHKIYVTHADDTDPALFAQMFKRVWKVLSLQTRRTLLKHWRECPPRFELYPDQDGRTPRQEGAALIFIAYSAEQPMFEAMIDTLAHAWLYAAHLADGRTPEETKEDIGCVLYAWGFMRPAPAQNCGNAHSPGNP